VAGKTIESATTPGSQSIHPVVQILRQRQSEGSRPGARRDHHRVGLAVEGGGVRGVVSAGMLTALHDLGLRDGFDVVYGASAGAFNATYFLSAEAETGLSIYYDQMPRREFLDYRRIVRGRPALNLDWIIEKVMCEIVPLNWAAVITCPIRLEVMASSAVTLRTVSLSSFNSPSELKTALKAGALIPFLAGEPVSFRDDLLLDAGVLQAHPFESAVAAGCSHILSLSTRRRGRLLSHATLAERLVAIRLDHLSRGLGAGHLERIRQYRLAQRQLADLSSKPGSLPPYILDVAPPHASAEVHRLDRNVSRILQGARAGYEAAMLVVDGRAARAFYRLTSSSLPSWCQVQKPVERNRPDG
jgi:predicted patatin/cPLA2 family phospholipase